jgi:hypothetical protein
MHASQMHVCFAYFIHGSCLSDFVRPAPMLLTILLFFEHIFGA